MSTGRFWNGMALNIEYFGVGAVDLTQAQALWESNTMGSQHGVKAKK